MESIAFFGKGGIGKSTISSNVSAILGKMGKLVLHIGCDPKADSTISLAGKPITPFSSVGLNTSERMLEKLIVKSPFIDRIDCLEAGGPEPGLGCAGVAIGTTLDALKIENIFEKKAYDYAIYDVLGDIVCGGFASPLRKGFAKKIAIVSSEEILSLYAANNLLKMAEVYSKNGVSLAGMILNIRDVSGVPLAQKFAETVNLPILGYIHRSASVYEAAKNNQPAVLFDQKSAFAKEIIKLTLTLMKNPVCKSQPGYLSEHDFTSFFSGKNTSSVKKISGKQDISPKQLTYSYLENLNLVLLGMKDGEVLLKYYDENETVYVIIAHKAEAKSGMITHSDWGAYIKPGPDKKNLDISAELKKALDSLALFAFKDFVFLAIDPGKIKKSFFGLTGKPQRVYHGLPYTVDDSSDFSKYSFIRIDRNTGQHACFLLDHTDEECRFNGKTFGGELGQFFVLDRDPQPHLPSRQELFINSFFSIKQSILGKSRGLQNALNVSLQQLKVKGKEAVECNFGCLPIMLFADVDNIVKKAEQDNSAKIICEDIHNVYDNSAEKLNIQSGLFYERLKNSARKKDFDVCLVDFSTYSDTVRQMLEEKGIRTIVQSEFASDEPAAAALQVLFNKHTLKNEVFQHLNYDFISPERPFGFKNTKKWLQTVACRLKEHGISSVNSNLDPNPDEKSEENFLQEKLAGIPFAFILTEEDLPLFLTENQNYPASSVFSFLRQTKMNVHLLIKKDDSGCAVKSSFDEAKALFFSDNRELQNLIYEIKDLKLIYSDFRDDSRILDMGKSPVSLKVLQAGYIGAIETLKRLAELSYIEL